MGEGERESDSGEAESCASPHHQLTVDSRAIKDTAVKAAHQINDNNSQKFLSRSLKKKRSDCATVRRNQFCLRKSEAKPEVETSDRQG